MVVGSSNQISQTLFEKVTNILYPVLRPVARWQTKIVEKRLRAYGLRWDDILDDSPEMLEALKMAPAHEIELRNRRLHRAIDLDLKHYELPQELQTLQAPFRPYLSQYVALIRQRQEEKVTTALPAQPIGGINDSRIE